MSCSGDVDYLVKQSMISVRSSSMVMSMATSQLCKRMNTYVALARAVLCRVWLK